MLQIIKSYTLAHPIKNQHCILNFQHKSAYSLRTQIHMKEKSSKVMDHIKNTSPWLNESKACTITKTNSNKGTKKKKERKRLFIIEISYIIKKSPH